MLFTCVAQATLSLCFSLEELYLGTITIGQGAYMLGSTELLSAPNDNVILHSHSSTSVRMNHVKLEDTLTTLE
jgi:hypothetical protein